MWTLFLYVLTIYVLEQPRREQCFAVEGTSSLSSCPLQQNDETVLRRSIWYLLPQEQRGSTSHKCVLLPLWFHGTWLCDSPIGSPASSTLSWKRFLLIICIIEGTMRACQRDLTRACKCSVEQKGLYTREKQNQQNQQWWPVITTVSRWIIENTVTW